MRRIEKAFSGRTFALAVFLAVYAGLLAITFMPRDGVSASAPYAPGAVGTTADSSVDLSVIAAK